MTNRNFLKKLKHSIILILSFVFLFCFSAFILSACNEEEATTTTTEETSKSYSYEYEEFDENISNANFAKNTADKKFDSYPIVSASDWTKAYNNNAVSSYVDSGVIDVSSTGWAELSKKLKEDDQLIKALSYYNFNNETSITTIKENFDDYFANPSTHEGATEGKMYMLNNYPQSPYYIGVGTAQSLTSSSSITLEKGKTAKISVWIKTINITGHGEASEIGANFSLKNSISGASQSNYELTAIDTKGEWKKFEIFVQADKNYDSSFTIVLGLGFGSGKSTAAKYYTQGTAFFDDLSYEIIDDTQAFDFSATNGTVGKLDISNEDACQVNFFKANQGNTEVCTKFGYDMSISNSLTSETLSLKGLKADANYFTSSNINDALGNPITSQSILGSTSSINKESEGVYKLNKASASIRTNSSESNGAIKVAPESYSFISFKIYNELKILGSTEVSVVLHEVDANGNELKKHNTNIKIEDPTEEEILFNLLVKNNFTTGDKYYFVTYYIGPANITNLTLPTDFATGTVKISEISYLPSTDIPGEDDDSSYYDFTSKVANASISLLGTADSDYVEDSDTSSESYPLSVKPSDIGTILTHPANVKNFDGVTSDHAYVNNSDNYSINTRSGNGEEGSYAGLINTKYLNKYEELLPAIPAENEPGITAAVGSDYSKDIQPLMIYNKTEDSYGFIGKKIDIAESSFAHFTFKVRVVGDAKAYIYLVDVADKNKSVLTFDDFTPNASEVAQQGSINGSTPLMMKVDKNTMAKTSEEWVTVDFYIATGATAKSVRLEVWNGSRDGIDTSKGYVFFEEITSVNLSSAFNESTTWQGAHEQSSHPLYNMLNSTRNPGDQLISYKRELSATETKFNEEYKDNSEYKSYLVDYKENYIWAKTDTLLYAVFNTVDPVEEDPYSKLPAETPIEETSGCSAQTDPSTFWLNFSSILLGIVLLLALVALFIKFYLRKQKANKSDAVSHYNVTSRIRSQRDIKRKQEESEENAQDDLEAEDQEDTDEEIEEQEIPAEEQDLDSYVYGDVIEDFTDNQTETEQQNESDTDVE